MKDCRTERAGGGAASTEQGAATTSDFVGRELELHRLRAAVDDALSGHGRLILLAGEPGIGKTRTAEELASYARSRRAAVLWGRCSEQEGAPPFWPWVQILRAALKIVGLETFTRTFGAAATALADLLPELRGESPDPPATESPDSPQARFRVFDGIGRLFERLAAETPVVLILDDLHGADASSLRLLEFLAADGRAPVLLAGFHRDGLPTTHPLSQTIVEALRLPGCQQMALSGLSTSEVERFIENECEVRPAASLVAAIHARTEGNPLFVKEYVRLLLAEQDRGRLADPTTIRNLRVPDSLRTVVGRRVAPLSVPCQAVLTHAAVIGRELPGNLLAAATAADGMSDVEISAALEEARAAGLITDGFAPRSYRFSHAVICESLYGETSLAERRRLHRLIGESLEARVDREQRLAELAHHFIAAGHDGDITKGIEYARQAGARAMAVLAYEEAVRLYRLALAALEGSDAAADGERCALLVDLGVALSALGDPDGSKRSLLDGADLARRLGRREELARAALNFGSKVTWGEGPIPDPVQLELIDAALAVWTGTATATEAALLARLAQSLRFSDEHERRDLATEQALSLARQVGDPATLLAALNARHTCCFRAATCDERLALAAEMVELAERTGDREMAFQAYVWRFGDLIEVGDRSGTDAALAARERLAGQLRQPYCVWANRLVRASLWMAEGRFAEAESEAEAALALGRSVNFGSEIVFHLQMAQLRVTQRKRDGLRALASSLGAYASAYPALPALAANVALCGAELADRELACRYYEPFATTRFDLPDDQNWLVSMSQLAATCVWLADAPRAALLYERLAPYELRVCAAAGSAVAVGPVALYLGQLAALLGRSADSVRHFETALALSTRMRWLPWRARTQYEYARLLRTRGEAGDEQRAGDLLDEALATARELDMPLLIEDAQALGGGRRPAIEGQRESPTAGSTTHSPESVVTAVLRRDGDYWILGCGDTVLRLKPSRGLHYLALLLRHPGQEVMAIDLAQNGTDGDHGSGMGERTANPSIPRFSTAALDAPAKAAYGRRLESLRDELREAEVNNDIGRTELARAEMDMLAEQLRGALGLGGRDRPVGSDLERARSAVGKRIRAEIKHIRAAHPVLGRHLVATITTGYFCAYEPERDAVVQWEL